MNNLIRLIPPTRINDHWIIDSSLKTDPSECKNFKHPLISGEPNDSKTRYQADFYKHISLDIVVETVLDYPYAYITEKTLRPIACKRMFIILGACNSLRLLHSMGFATFDDFIDESYDSIIDPKKRFLAVKNEVIRLCNMPLETIKQYMLENAHKLDLNFSILANLQDRELKKIAQDHGIDI
jgi:hypothetical protein